jgi:predicted CXXCH cytochrome family protein
MALPLLLLTPLLMAAAAFPGPQQNPPAGTTPQNPPAGTTTGSGSSQAAAAAPGKQKKPPPFPLNLYARATPDDYEDERACSSPACHGKAAASFENSPHASYVHGANLPPDHQGCQACHGPGVPHTEHLAPSDHPYEYVISYTHAKPMEVAQACLRCHNDTITLAHWQRTGHARAKVTCTACHQMHWQDRLGEPRTTLPPATQAGKFAQSPVFPSAPEPKALLKADEATLCSKCHQAEVNEFRQNFHHPVPEGRMVCSDCHDIHTNRDGRKRFQTAKQSCITCHPQVAGPFVYEHDPTSFLSGDGCMECHRPHGSPNPQLLNAFSRGLCLQCHSDKVVDHFPGRTCWQSGCHVAPHGSNHSELFFQP